MNLGKLGILPDGEKICVSVMVEEIREYEGNRGVMAFVLVKDSYAEVEMVVFSKVYIECKELLFGDETIWVTAQVDKSRGSKYQAILVAIDIAREQPGKNRCLC